MIMALVAETWVAKLQSRGCETKICAPIMPLYTLIDDVQLEVARFGKVCEQWSQE